MSTPITLKQMTDFIWETLEESVAEFPEDEREEAKARVLEAWGASMFYGTTKENT